MNHRRWIEWIAYLVGYALLGYAWITLVPASLLSDPWNPAHFASMAAVVAAAGLIPLRLFLMRHVRLTRLLFAATLVFMALIYLWAALQRGDRQAVMLESLGLVVFAGVALLGYLRSTLLLGLGIAAHGALWDTWHHHHSGYVESWYPLGCLLFDVAFGMMIVASTLASGSAQAQGLATPHTR
jgi:hypothetical protein